MTGGIVAEFNPFHAGHAALVRASRFRGASHIVAVMSGNFVQRGDLAVTDKRIRTRCALEGGVDLVVELPLPAATATAQRFARGAVQILAALGCVDMLCFGSECGSAETLHALADALDEPAVDEALRTHLAHGVTYAKARQLAVEDRFGPDLSAQLAAPNNALAVEYLRAANLLHWEPGVFTLVRRGAGHDAAKAAGRYASGSYLRSVASDLDTVRRYVPRRSIEILEEANAIGIYPADPRKLETAMLTHLRRLSPVQLAALPDISEGIENRLYAAVRDSTTYAELCERLKTKRYTMARVRRLLLHAFLDITVRDMEQPMPYVRVLGFNKRGRELLSQMSDRVRLPVSSSLAKLREVNAACARFAALEEQATDLYTLALPTPQACGYDLRASGVYLK